MTSKRVMLVDDHAIFRDALAMLLTHRFGFEVVATASHLNDITTTVATQQPDILFMDYHLPGGDALSCGNKIKAAHPDLALIYLTGTQSSEVLSQLVNSNANAVLHKELSPEELTDALATIQNGEQAVSPQIQAKLPDAERFTPREFQMLRLLAQGLSTKQVADALSISTRTAEKHRENLFKKAEVKNLAQLIEQAYKWQVLDLEAGS